MQPAALDCRLFQSNKISRQEHCYSVYRFAANRNWQRLASELSALRKREPFPYLGDTVFDSSYLSPLVVLFN